MDAYDIANKIMKLWRENVSLGNSSGLMDKSNLRVPLKIKLNDDNFVITDIKYDKSTNTIILTSEGI